MLTIAPGDPIPNGIETTYAYDSLGRLDVMTDADTNGNVTASYDYQVRADGRRTGSTETFWIDANEDGVQDAGELKSTDYAWSYDGLNRLTDEVIDHWDDAFDQTESYGYDLTGNRTTLDRDKGNDGTIDEAITYSYDANDRLLEETLNSLAGADTTTTYGYDRTQQTSKVVTAGGVNVSSQSFTYNLQGRLSEAVVDKYATDGTFESRERSSYEYDMRSFRVGQQLEDWNDATGEFEFKSETEFLVSHRNMTGYAQTLRETTTNADGSTKTIDYTFSHDEIAQRVVTNDGQGGTTDETHVFGHDGHGSVRVLYDLAASASSLIEQLITYSAYGSVAAVHGTTGSVIGTSEAAAITSLLYSGEAFDHTIQKGYNRARWYDPRSAQWNRLDPFIGNIQDPQSLHKYAYVHGDPANAVDPTGKFSSGEVFVSLAIGLGNVAQELTTGGLVLTLLETGGKAGFGARDAGLLMIAEGKFEVGFLLFNLGSRILKLTLDVIGKVDAAIGFLTLGTAAAIAGYALARRAPDLADNLFNLAKNFRSKRKPGQVNLGLCFAPETSVATVGGPKAIRDIKIGDRVRSYDFEKSDWDYSEVTNTSTSQFSGKFVRVAIGGELVECTAYHPFWIISGEDLDSRPVPRELKRGEDEGLGTQGRWVNSHDLKVGDCVLAGESASLVVESITVSDVEHLDVCNLTISKTHVYTVGDSGAVVHNTSGSSIGDQFRGFGSNRLRANQLPNQLDDELATAAANGVTPLKVGDPGFDEVVNSGTIKWAVDESGTLWVVPATKNGTEISHAVLVGGGPVKAAGQADVAGSPGTYLGLDITPHSGHYNNGASAADNAETVAVGSEAFAKNGITF